MREYWVYILRCSDNSYYTGVTNDIDRRVYEHQQGLIPGSFTHSRRPCVLVYADSTDDICAAIEREKQIKGWSRKKKEALIAQKEYLLPPLARGRTGYMKQQQ